MTAPAPSITEVTSYSEMIAAIRTQVGALGVRYEDFDELAGFAAGLSGKVFGPSMVKRLGPEKLFDAMRAAGLRIKLEPDPDQLEKMRIRIAENYNPRQGNQARMNNSASPAGTYMMSRVFKHFAKLGGKARMAKMTPKERRSHQQMAALAKAKQDRKRRKALHQRRIKDAKRRLLAPDVGAAGAANDIAGSQSL